MGGQNDPSPHAVTNSSWLVQLGLHREGGEGISESCVQGCTNNVLMWWVTTKAEPGTWDSPRSQWGAPQSCFLHFALLKTLFSQRVQHYLFLSPGEKCKIWNAGQENFWLTVKVIHLHSHSSRHSLSTRKCCNI